MTVIACNAKEMAADTLVTLDNHPGYHTTKIFRLGDGSIVGGAGGHGLDDMLAWLRAGEIEGNAPVFHEWERAPDFVVLRLKPDGIWLYADGVYAERMKERTYAIGSGVDIALYALRHLKAKPADAVRAACKLSPGCGGPVETLRLQSR